MSKQMSLTSGSAVSAEKVATFGGDEFKEVITEKILGPKANDRFAEEEVKSDYGYPFLYRPKRIAEQIGCLRELFPILGTADVKLADQPLPDGAEAWFAIPCWECVAATYNHAVEIILELIKCYRNGAFFNYRANSTGFEHMRQHKRTQIMLEKLSETQKGHDILIVPAQLGLRHRGRSARRARSLMSNGEFGLGVFEVGIILLTHPERLMKNIDLGINCAGDEYDYPGFSNRFLGAPFFNFCNEQIEFGTIWVGGASTICGSASGFVPI